MKRSATFLFIMFMTMITAHAQDGVSGPIVIKATYFDVSPPLRDMVILPGAKVDMTWKDGVVKNILTRDGKNPPLSNNDNIIDPGLQNWNGTSPADTTIQNFDGVNNLFGGVPPDTDGDVGPNHFFQIVNVHYAVYNKSGVKVLGPNTNSSIFSGMPNNSNDGDGVVIYDEVADRWIFSQFSLPNYPAGPFYQMVAVSQTADPTGSWYRYQFQFTTLPDYPKLAIWPDAIYMTMNRFSANSLVYQGVGVCALNRTKMYAGQPNAEMVMFNLNASNNAWRMLPSDCDGEYPPAGTPNYVAYHNDGPDQIVIYEFHVDWNNTANSTFNQTNVLSISSFNGNISGGIPQKGTSVKLDPFSGTFMYRLPFRKFSDHWSMVGCATINVGSNVAGIRWYEMRKTTTNPWSVYQSGTYNPDSKCRWMGSIAIDTSGNIALGYSISSTDIFPSIKYTGRMHCDPLGVMTIAESGIINGGGAQTNTWSGSPSRWGDYSCMTSDPTEPSKFWYTNEYYQTTSQANWRTRVGSFSLADYMCADAMATPDIICWEDTSQLDVSVSGGSGTYTYEWTSNPPGFNSTAQNPLVIPDVTTMYYVEVDDGNVSKTDSVKVTVNIEPAVNAGNDTMYCIWVPSFQMDGSGSNYASLHWSTSGDGTFTNPSAPHTYYYPGEGDKNNGSVLLTLTAYPKIPCSDTVSDDVLITFDPCTGISEPANIPFGIAVHPNPSTGQVIVVINGAKNNKVQLVFSDSRGKILFTDIFHAASGRFEQKIDLSTHPKGAYFIQVITNNGIATSKVILQ